VREGSACYLNYTGKTNVSKQCDWEIVIENAILKWYGGQK